MLHDPAIARLSTGSDTRASDGLVRDKRVIEKYIMMMRERRVFWKVCYCVTGNICE